MTLKEWVKSLADRLQKIEDTGGGGGVTPEYVDTKVGVLRTQLQGQIDSTNTVVDGHTTEIDALTSTVDSLTDDVMDNRTDINALESSMTTVQQGVASLQSTVNGHTQMIAQLGGQVEQNTTDIGNAVNRIGQNETDISQLNNTITELIKRVDVDSGTYTKTLTSGETYAFRLTDIQPSGYTPIGVFLDAGTSAVTNMYCNPTYVLFKNISSANANINVNGYVLFAKL